MDKIKLFLSVDMIKKIGAILFLIGILLEKFDYSFLKYIGLSVEYIGIACLIYWGIKYKKGNKYIWLLYPILAIAFIIYALI